MSSEENESSELKWNCPSCTYLNWPKSVKCTICSVPNPYLFLIEKQCTNDAKQPEETLKNKEIAKWTCSICTYENWPKSLKCVQCLTPRFKNESLNEDSSSESYDGLAESDASCKTDCKIASKAKFSCDSVSKIQSLTPPLEVSLIESEMRKSSSTEEVSLLPSVISRDFNAMNKWNCSLCTYENWPKSTKCVICHTPKAATNVDSTSMASSFVNEPQNQASPGREEPLLNTENSDISNQIFRPKSYPSHMVINNTIRRIGRDKIDWTWLDACIGVVNDDNKPVMLYLKSGGDLARQLSLIEANLLNRPSAFEVGYTLVHLAVRFKRNKILELLLQNRDASRVKRVPCSTSLNFAPELRRHVNNCFKQRKGDFSCNYVTEFVTFALPQEIEELTPSAQQRLFDELLDRDVQKELEEDSSIINWSLEISARLGSRLYALWNRSTGDCLLDSALQSTWGLFDKENRLRKALSESLNEASHTLFARFKEAQILSASHHIPYTLDKLQWEEDWAVILSLASQPGSALEQFHIFVLAHILRRPIIVYGVKYVKSFRGETLSLAGFQGIYLPLHWGSSFCWKSPIALGYTRGHFTALVPMESIANCLILDCGCKQTLGGPLCEHCKPNAKAPVISNDDSLNYCYLPLVNSDHEILPLHFLNRNEIGKEEEIMREYLDCCLTESGTLVAKQKLGRNPYLMKQMMNEWIEFYRDLPSHSNQAAKSEAVDALDADTDTSNINYGLSDTESD